MPGRTVKLRSSTASLSPYRLVNPLTSIIPLPPSVAAPGWPAAAVLSLGPAA
jgi:hypothetical protein